MFSSAVLWLQMTVPTSSVLDIDSLVDPIVVHVTPSLDTDAVIVEADRASWT